MTDKMQVECRSLLTKLRLKQRNLHNFIKQDTLGDSVLSDSVMSDTISDTSPRYSSSYARNKLRSLITSPTSSSQNDSICDNRRPQTTFNKNSYNNIYETSRSTFLPTKDSKNIPGNFLRDISNYYGDNTTADTYDIENTNLKELDTMSQSSSTPPRWRTEKISSLPSTPNTIQRRNIIDRNIPVSSKYENLQLDTNSSKLNFSYSDVDDEEFDDSFLKSKLLGSPEDIFLKNDKDYQMKYRERQVKDTDSPQVEKKTHIDKKEYDKQLQDVGNSKNYASIVREASKPRSILSSPGSRSSNKSKSSSRVSFKTASFNETPQTEVTLPSTSKLMGYDWIAALLDNETGDIDDSENYFKELKEFRRSNRDECCNDFYKNNLLTFAEPKEETVVEKALTEPKVKPYIVNDRLFTEPLKKPVDNDNIVESDDEEEKSPTQATPRYVRVSIPRSTLEKPYKFKPHRRNSFDPTDSCSLRDHCLMGWENSRVSSLPTASSLDINDATDEFKPKRTTTLAEAELIAKTSSTQMWPFVPPPIRTDPLPNWRKNYEASIMNLSQPSLTTSSIPGDSDSLRKSTNSLLNSTYSLMYEMERLKKERESAKA